MAGSKRSRAGTGNSSKDLGFCLSVASASATPASSPSPAATDAASMPSFPSGGGSDGISLPSGGGGGAAGDGSGGTAGGAQVQAQQGTNTDNVINVEDDAGHIDGDGPPAKRQKKCTSDVWQYFTKKTVIIEDNGKVYQQIWAHCDFPKCKHKGRCESNYGKNITTVTPYRYDEEASLRKFYLAIVMHEYPFNISEHEYFVEFIKSLRPSFPIKSRVTIRKEILNMYVHEKEKLYAYFTTVNCRFSATMDMWTSNQNKSYMCVTLHWVDENWCIQKRIVNFVHVEGRHTGIKLSETFTKLMVK